MKEKIENEFKRLCQLYKRKGVIGFSLLKDVKLLPAQKKYLKKKLFSFDCSQPITAVSIGIFYTPEEIFSIPDRWVTKVPEKSGWNKYARACKKLNRILNKISRALEEKFGGIAEQATLEGYTCKIKQVEEYFNLCVSHRAFVEASGLGWKGKSRLIITPENGPALRLSTIFLPCSIKSRRRKLSGCQECQACLEVCPFFKNIRDYRQSCLLRLRRIKLENEVCGICIRVCWEKIVNKSKK